MVKHSYFTSTETQAQGDEVEEDEAVEAAEGKDEAMEAAEGKDEAVDSEAGEVQEGNNGDEGAEAVLQEERTV